MKKELVIKKCKNCNALVRVIEDCNCNDCGIKCCGDKMEILTPNSVDAAVEKHIPYFKSGEEAVAEFEYVPSSKVYAYCNKHGLLMKEVE